MATSQSHGIPEEFRREFTNTLEHEIQQVKSKFSGHIKIEGFNGKSKVFNSMDSFEFEPRVGRLPQSAPSEVTLHARQLTKVPFVAQKIFDKFDKENLGDLGLPDSETIQAMKMAFGRLIDKHAAIAADGTVYGGVEPFITAIDMPAGQTVPVGYKGPGVTPANTGLNPEKLIAAKKIFALNEIDITEQEICLSIDPQGEEDLMQYVKSAGNDVWAKMISAYLEDPTKKLMGFTVIVSNRNVDAGSNITKCFAYAKNSGIYMAPEKLEVEMDILPTEQHALQITAYATLGFMRRFEKSVVMIPCDRT